VHEDNSETLNWLNAPYVLGIFSCSAVTAKHPRSCSTHDAHLRPQRSIHICLVNFGLVHKHPYIAKCSKEYMCTIILLYEARQRSKRDQVNKITSQIGIDGVPGLLSSLRNHYQRGKSHRRRQLYHITLESTP